MLLQLQVMVKSTIMFIIIIHCIFIFQRHKELTNGKVMGIGKEDQGLYILQTGRSDQDIVNTNKHAMSLVDVFPSSLNANNKYCSPTSTIVSCSSVNNSDKTTLGDDIMLF
ncbi:uncharacterized protein LOC132609753 [Lycium barbarum]|uniref:uncharacterized protein LOC132609753 n=1 Tax=Lycium barbarum TaxID=112863 RepID=UPI00293EEB58|nr:uncharacterized protein LOC132609753 [Lycium barbarum]